MAVEIRNSKYEARKEFHFGFRASCFVLPAKRDRGFALLIAVIFMSVMLAFGLALGSLAYKQQVLASTAIESQYAFYAADAALECALYADQQQNLFPFPQSNPNAAPAISCDNISSPSSQVSYTASVWVVTNRFSLDSNTSHPRCADVKIYKPPPNSGTTYVFSQGYDVACSAIGNARSVSRGLKAQY